MKLIQLTLIVLYLLLAVLFSYLMTKKYGSWERGIFSFVVCIGFPLAGFLFLWFCDYYAEKQKDKDFSEFYVGDDFKRDNLRFLTEADPARELNQVPMAEALAIDSFEYRRNMIMQLLNEEDTLQYLEVLQDALDNEDTETSHYASTVIMELQRKVQEELIEREVLYEQNPTERAYALEWEETLYKILNSNIYDEQNRRRYFVKYARVSDDLLSDDLPPEKHLQHRIRILFMEKNFTAAQSFCSRYLELYPGSEDAVLCQIELYIQSKDSGGMAAFLATLSQRPVLLTQKTLQYIRVFRKE